MRWLLITALVGFGCRPQHVKQHTCDKPIGGLATYLKPGAIVWFGEMHGTEESPRFVGDAACEAAKVAHVQLGLEIPHAEQPAFDRYLKSKGSDADRAALVAGPFWQQADGRSSLAMVALVERVRVLRAAGAPIDLVLYDDPTAGRDEAMAKMVMRLRDPKAIFVALSGNVHSRRTKGARWDPNLVPTVAHLVAAKLPVTTFNVSAAGGTLWACMSGPDEEPECGEHPNSNDGAGTPWTLGPPRDDAHDGVYFVGATQASYPAKQSR
ncbi:MAG TPA: hypothetical protein VFV99_06400 [Kofleriaceae bacterium]|nr:hypothetical protein [Kofleriaceae bacterium]